MWKWRERGLYVSRWKHSVVNFNVFDAHIYFLYCVFVYTNGCGYLYFYKGYNLQRAVRRDANAYTTQQANILLNITFSIAWANISKWRSLFHWDRVQSHGHGDTDKHTYYTYSIQLYTHRHSIVNTATYSQSHNIMCKGCIIWFRWWHFVLFVRYSWHFFVRLHFISCTHFREHTMKAD